jgi:DNA-binding response OmpR family regulator
MAKVLVIEDDRDLYSLFGMILKMAGYEVSIAQDGQDAWDLLSPTAAGSLPDAITLDLHLPRVSGNDIYNMLEERNEAHRVLVVSADVREVENYILKGANALSKPVAMDVLIQRVNEISKRSLVVGAQ